MGLLAPRVKEAKMAFLAQKVIKGIKVIRVILAPLVPQENKAQEDILVKKVKRVIKGTEVRTEKMEKMAQ